MGPKQLRTLFKDRLRAIYPPEEIESIFSLVAESLLNYSKIDLHVRSDENLAPSHIEKFEEVLHRLVQNEPIQYVLGETEFYGSKLKVDQRVLIPRSETEFLVELMLNEVPSCQPIDIIDLCTGSGCIAIALAKKLPLARLTAVDVSKEALEVAAVNAKKNATDISFIEDSVLSPVSKYHQYHYLVSNPPYVRASEKKLMHANVLQYEPSLALFVDDSDPLLFYRAIARFANQYLVPAGEFFVEINEKLGAETALLFEENGFVKVAVLKDLHGKDRFVKGEKR